mgnify:CR=1 FL=1
MFNQRFKKSTALCLAVLTALTVPIGVMAADGTASSYKKDEVVYSLLDAAGSVSAVYVVNQFELTAPADITDYGDYASVVNLSTTDTLTSESGAVGFHADTGNFYYQGNARGTELPWKFYFNYTLDGAPVDASALSGATGALEMHIVTSQNPAVDSTFYDNYMLQIAVSLPSEAVSNVTAEGATIAVAGQNMSVNFTVMPGTDGDFTLSGDVKDFYSDGIQITGMPLSLKFDSFDTEGWVDDMQSLSDAIAELNSGVSDLTDGAITLNSGAKDLKDGSADIKTGLLTLNQGSAQIKSGSASINSALQQISAGLSGGSGSVDLSSLSSLPTALNQMADALSDISDALDNLDSAFSSAYSALDTAIGAIPASSLSQADIDALYAGTDASLHGSLDILVANYAAAKTVVGTYASVKPAFDSVASSLPTLAGSVDTVAANLSATASGLQSALDTNAFVAQLSALTTSITTLSTNYASFNSGLIDYVNGVSTIAAQYPTFNSGLAKAMTGVSSLTSGLGTLEDGTETLHDKTKDMPQEFQDKIDEMTAVFSGDDFVPVSFTDSRNSQVNLVQFVMKTDSVSAPGKTTNDRSADTESTDNIWDRLQGLFE